MKVMSFNVKNDGPFTRLSWQKRKDIAIDMIYKHKPDIIGFQELTHKHNIKLEGYEILGDYRSRKYSATNESCAIAYNLEKYDLISSKTFWLSNTPNIMGSKLKMSIFPRVVTHIRLVDKSNKQILNIFNTHLDHVLPNVRKAETDIMIDIIKKFSDEAYVIMGDFNTNYKSKALNNLMDNLSLNLCYKDMVCHNTYNGKIKFTKLPIDYILINRHLKFDDTKIIKDHKDNIYPSDHFPILCDINYVV